MAARVVDRAARRGELGARAQGLGFEDGIGVAGGEPQCALECGRRVGEGASGDAG